MAESEDVVEPVELPRFGPLRPVPPTEVAVRLTGAAAGTTWSTSRIGNEGGYPNGGLWRVSADRCDEPGPTAAVVKRTGAAHLGTFRVWRGRADPLDPQWWGREAEFYLSDLGSRGWSDQVRAARCFVDDHDGCRDLWLEEVTDVPGGFEVSRRAVEGLAAWQVANAAAPQPWLAKDWIATHVRRHGLDNDRTLAHPAWSAAIDRGLDPALREAVAARVTDPTEVVRRLSCLPQVLTHHDFHNANLGTVDGAVVLFDWAYVGWGPIGHDVGHLAMTLEPSFEIEAAVAWPVLQDAYCQALVSAGWTGDLDLVHQSMAVSNQLRLGWQIDTLLDSAERLPDTVLAAASRQLLFLENQLSANGRVS